MRNFLAAVSFSALAIVGLADAAHAQGCTWAGNHWDCGDRHVYPRWYYNYPAGAIGAQPAPPPIAPGYPPPPGYPPRPY